MSSVLLNELCLVVIRSEMFLYTRLSDISFISITTKSQAKQKNTDAM